MSDEHQEPLRGYVVHPDDWEILTSVCSQAAVVRTVFGFAVQPLYGLDVWCHEKAPRGKPVPVHGDTLDAVLRSLVLPRIEPTPPPNRGAK